MEYDEIGEWMELGSKIRYRKVLYYDFVGEPCIDFEFEIYKRPYFWGLIGKKQWMWQITTNDSSVGYRHCFELI